VTPVTTLRLPTTRPAGVYGIYDIAHFLGVVVEVFHKILNKHLRSIHPLAGWRIFYRGKAGFTYVSTFQQLPDELAVYQYLRNQGEVE